MQKIVQMQNGHLEDELPDQLPDSTTDELAEEVARLKEENAQQGEIITRYAAQLRQAEAYELRVRRENDELGKAVVNMRAEFEKLTSPAVSVPGE